MTWTKITFSSPSEPASESLHELLSCELLDHGALGTSLEGNRTVVCFAESKPDLLKALKGLGAQYGFSIVEEASVQLENWNQQCNELWQPFTRGVLTVVPVESVLHKAELQQHEIKIIPGLGFGTGHHPTTNMMLGVLSNLYERTTFARPTSIYDLGTGSGILAIAAAKLFACPITAIDIDPHAIENAKENVEMNHLSQLISCSTAAASTITGPFDLILANVYGEVLMQLAYEITRVAAPRSTLILSGITELVRDQVIFTYTEEFGWKVVDELSEGGWVCVSLAR